MYLYASVARTDHFNEMEIEWHFKAPFTLLMYGITVCLGYICSI